MPRIFAKIDLLILTPALLLSLFGLLMIFSVSFESDQSFFIRQSLYLLVALIVFFILSKIDFKVLSSLSPFIYIGVLILLLVTSLFGTEVQGSVRWIDLGVVTLQPSEFTKPVLILFFVFFFAKFPPRSLRNISIAIILAAIPVLFIFQQPDFGNAFLVGSIWAFMIFLAGLPMVYLFISVVGSFLISPLIWTLLKEYQRVRVVSFLNLSADPQGASYNVVQALIAFGSGQVFGKGLGKGTQSHLDFLPAEKTDFIFAATGEELGFFGICILLLVFSFFIVILLKLASELNDKAGKLLVFSVAFSIFLQFFINTGVNVGLIPVTGITLPFVSFGGSSLVSLFAALGMVQSAKNTLERQERDMG